MFDITSSKLLLLAIVALLVIGPKDFPVLLRTIGRYVGIIRGHAREFRAQFDEAMRESELADLKKEMETIGRETEASMNSTAQSVEQTFADARQSVEDRVTAPVSPVDPAPVAPGSNETSRSAVADAASAPSPAVDAASAVSPAALEPATSSAQQAAAERTGV
ncbi:MAG TPA: Sec-independent protein translocase protein TatB [Hyphomicrobiaceae bacterium]|nr:Sec-independent protein translocase protein TatB [Hyphomicrobiaceae bacterium]